jgi:hypothetical protein
MTESEYLEKRLEDQIRWYSTKSQWNQKLYKRLRIVEITAACMIPFFVGYIDKPDDLFKVLTGLLGVTVAIVSGIVALFKFQENWIEYRTTSESLKHEKYLYLTNSEPYDVDDKFPLLVERLESFISKENTRWSQYIKRTMKEKGD